LNGQPRDLVVRTKDGALRTSDPEAYMQQQLGWSLPIAGLRWWVLGIPAPGSAPRVQIDEQGRALSLDQDGWHIDYSEYQTFGERPVPRKIELASAERGFRLVIDQWLELASTQ
jgi:outer membrane lipoprotein LolB